jgi:hypothetical protein
MPSAKQLERSDSSAGGGPGPMEACRLCGSAELVGVLDLGEQAMTGVFPSSPDESVPKAPLSLVWCRSCTLLQLGESLDPGDLYGAGYGYRSGLNASMVDHLARLARGLESLVALSPGDVVLDIGSNDGTLLGCYTTEPLRRIGIDPTAAKFAEHYPPGVVTAADFFSAATFRELSDAKARIITSVAMFYDLEDPVAFASDVRECLAPDGIWHFEQAYLPSMLRATAYDTVCHEHLEYYSLATVTRILEEAGLEVVEVGFNRINGGSFGVTAAHRSSGFARRGALLDWLGTQEQRLGLDTEAPFRTFAERVSQHREDLVQLLRALRQDGASIMGYGASTKGNVLLQYCGFTSTDIEAIGEVNPEKFGHVTPGSLIPIISEREMWERRPDYLLVLPWHFRETVIAREEAYLRSGGRLVFPLPEIEILGA